MQHAFAKADANATTDFRAPTAANDAVSWLRTTQRLNPAGASAEVDDVEVLRDVDHWRATEPGFAALTNAGASTHTALRGVGLYWWSHGQPARAVRPFLAALLFGPESPDVLIDLGSVLQADGRPDEGLAAYLRATQIAPSDARPWLKAALLLQAEGQVDIAGAYFEVALSCDAGCVDAAAGLGMVRFAQRRYVAAAQHLATAASYGPNQAIGLALGQALYLTGDFAGAAEAFRPHVEAGVADARIQQRFALCFLLERAIAGATNEGLDAWRKAAGRTPGESGRVIRQAFDILRSYGYRDAALRLATLGSSDIHPYLVDVLHDAPLACAPNDYIVEHFNGFADAFETQLVDVLGYDVPRTLAQLIAHHVERPLRIADLGCGTGLAGVWLKSLASELTGVDLSSRMLEKARDKGVYDALHEADIDRFLESCSKTFDCLTLADVLIYRGSLQSLFRSASNALASGGLIAFSIETTTIAPYELRRSGRFAHNVDAICADAAPWFEAVEIQPSELRQEANAPVAGALLLLRRKP